MAATARAACGCLVLRSARLLVHANVSSVLSA